MAADKVAEYLSNLTGVNFCANGAVVQYLGNLGRAQYSLLSPRESDDRIAYGQ